METVAIWTERLAVFALILFAVGVLLIRNGSYRLGFAGYGVATLLAIVCFAFLVLILIMHKNNASSWILLLLCAVPSALAANLIINRGDFPQIHDITTNTLEPPVFEKAPELRSPGANALDIDPATIELQTRHYPDIASLALEAVPPEIYANAIEYASQQGWQVYHENPDNLSFEAVASTMLLNYKDDIVIRIRTENGKSVVDARSASRIGRGDLGANAKRIREFLNAMKTTHQTQTQ